MRHLATAALLLASLLNAQAEPVAGDPRHAKIYDLGDLVADAPAAAELVLSGPANDAPAPPTGGMGPAAIARLVRAFVRPAMQPDEDVQPLGERWLVLLARPAQHAWVERFLATARTERDLKIDIGCSLYSMPEMVYQRDVRPALEAQAPAGARGAGVVLAPGAGTDGFLKALEVQAKVERIAAPRLRIRPLSTATLSVINQTSYVRDFEVEVAEAAFLANPIVDVVQDGLSLRAAATGLSGDTLGLSVDVKVADLKKPIPTFTTTLGGSTLPVTIQLPQVLSTQIEAAVELPKQHIVVFALPSLAGVRYLVTLQVDRAEDKGKRDK